MQKIETICSYLTRIFYAFTVETRQIFWSRFLVKFMKSEDDNVYSCEELKNRVPAQEDLDKMLFISRTFFEKRKSLASSECYLFVHGKSEVIQ